MLDVEPGALDLDRFVALRAEARLPATSERRSELLRQALELWRDTPLADLSAEPFAAAAAARLEEQRLDAARAADRSRPRCWAATPRSCRSSSRSSRTSPTASGCARSSCSRCIAPVARPTRSAPIGPPAARSATTSDSNLARSFASSRRRSCVTTRDFPSTARPVRLGGASRTLLESPPPAHRRVLPRRRGSVERGAAAPGTRRVDTGDRAAGLRGCHRPWRERGRRGAARRTAAGPDRQWYRIALGRKSRGPNADADRSTRRADPQDDRARRDAHGNRRRLGRRLGGPRAQRTAFQGRSRVRPGDDDRRPRRKSRVSADRRCRRRCRPCLGRLREVDARPSPARKHAGVGLDRD